jgi:hypothetical protein
VREGERERESPPGMEPVYQWLQHCGRPHILQQHAKRQGENEGRSMELKCFSLALAQKIAPCLYDGLV